MFSAARRRCRLSWSYSAKALSFDSLTLRQRCGARPWSCKAFRGRGDHRAVTIDCLCRPMKATGRRIACLRSALEGSYHRLERARAATRLTVWSGVPNRARGRSRQHQQPGNVSSRALSSASLDAGPRHPCDPVSHGPFSDMEDQRGMTCHHPTCSEICCAPSVRGT